MKLPLLAAVAALLSWCALDAHGAASPSQFPHPERIRYDGQCLTIEGKDTFIFSGAFHYFRCPKELWAARFQTIKDAGFNTVETYVPWNWHEREMPAALDDFSKVDLRDLDDWLTMAEKFGFYVIIRPGPYICAEWDTGGFPRWLLTKKPETPRRNDGWLRSDDPVYFAWTKHWYDAVCPVIAKHQITHREPGTPGIILFQIENEYLYSKFSDEVKVNQLRALAENAKAQGIDVPLFTCETQPARGSTDPLLSQVFDTNNFYPRWNVDGVRRNIEKLHRDQPDAPSMTTELQGGWFAEVGGKLSEQQDGVTASQIQNLTLYAIQNGNTLTNYYMLFGGTNFDDWSARLLPTTYDYAAPIRESGGVGERYARVWAIGHMLREHGAKLTRAVPVACDVTAPDKDVQGAIRRAPDGSRYIFIRTNQHAAPRKGEARFKEKDNAAAPELVVPYDLEPFGSQVLYLAAGVDGPMQGKWLLESKSANTAPQTPSQPKPVEFTRVTRCDDPLPTQWTPLKPGQALENAGVFDSHPVYYRLAVKPGMRLDTALRHGDGASASAAGKLLAREKEWAGNAAFSLPDAAAAEQAVLLYDNAGHDNIDLGMEEPGGIQSVRVSAPGKLPEMDLTDWQMGKPRAAVSGTDAAAIKALAESVENWQPAKVSSADAKQIKSGETTLFRVRTEVSAERLAAGETVLKFSRISDRGAVFVNGEPLGETVGWAAHSIAGRLDQPSFDAARLLHAGSNEILVLVQIDNRTGGLGPVRFGAKEADASPLEIAAGTEREHGQAWSQADFNDSTWQTVKLGAEPSVETGSALLAWHRMEFEMPAPTPDSQKTPWYVRLDASGNGFIYLNGHCLGRQWQAGPQRDFYLPECWLNFGSGKKNVLAVSLRPLDQGAMIRAAQIVP